MIIILILLVFVGIFFFGFNYYSNGKVYGEEKKKLLEKRLMILPFGILATYIILFFSFKNIFQS